MAKLKLTGPELRVLDIVISNAKDEHYMENGLVNKEEEDALDSVHDKVLKAKVK